MSRSIEMGWPSRMIAPRVELLEDPRGEPERRVLEREAQCVGLGGLDLHVGEAVADAFDRGGERGLLLVGDAAHGVGIVGRRHGEEHVGVDGGAVRAVVLAEVAGDDGAPVAALCEVAVVAELVHQVCDGVGDTPGVDPAFGGRAREAVAGHRDHHDVEIVRQQRKRIEELDDRSGPPVREHQRDRVGRRRPGVQEVHAQAGGLGDRAAPPVELGFGGPPVVPVDPVLDHRAQERLVGAVVPSGPIELGGPAGAREASAEIVEVGVGDVDHMRRGDGSCGVHAPDSHTARSLPPAPGLDRNEIALPLRTASGSRSTGSPSPQSRRARW